MIQHEKNTQKHTKVGRSLRLGGLAVIIGIIIALASFFVGVHRSLKASQANALSTPASARCLLSTSTSPWTPLGTWKLTITFLHGPRTGQAEQSVMQFAPSAKLSAAFPGSTPTAPAVLPPTQNGYWCMTGIHAFRYQFRETIPGGGEVNVYIQAEQTSPTTYVGVGFGIVSSPNGQPLPGPYTLSQTLATAIR